MRPLRGASLSILVLLGFGGAARPAMLRGAPDCEASLPAGGCPFAEPRVDRAACQGIVARIVRHRKGKDLEALGRAYQEALRLDCFNAQAPE